MGFDRENHYTLVIFGCMIHQTKKVDDSIIVKTFGNIFSFLGRKDCPYNIIYFATESEDASLELIYEAFESAGTKAQEKLSNIDYVDLIFWTKFK